MSIMPPASDSNATPHESDPDDQFWTITVDIPRTATHAEVEAIFDAVADAAYDAQPEGRGWDVFIYGHGPRPEDFPVGDAR